MGNREVCDECKLKCLQVHGRKKDPSPLVTTFHKILFGVYDYSKHLCLPQKISQAIPILVAGQDHVLEDTNGQHWKVTLSTKDGHLAFEKGWDNFFADHGLREGYILAFHYIMNSHFVVQIIDNTGFEKLKFPITNGKKKKRSKIDVNGNAVEECHNLFNHSTKKQGSMFSDISDSAAGIHSQPMSKDKASSLENGNRRYQHVAPADSDIEQVYMITRAAGYIHEEDRSPLLDFINFETHLRVDPDGSSDKRTHPSTTLAKGNAVPSNSEKNPNSTKVVTGEPQAKEVGPTFSNNNNLHLKRENVAEVVNDHHGDPKYVLPVEDRAQLHSEYRIKSSTTSSKRVKIEVAAGSKKYSSEILKLAKAELMELGKSPSCGLMSSENYQKFKERPDQIFGGDGKINVGKVVKSEPVDSFNGQHLDASALSFTVIVGSSELLELPTSVTLWAYVEKKVVNLKGPDKRVWPVLYHHKFGIKALTSGWKNFFTSYKLQIGDECAFILENEAETIFRIDVNSK